MGNGVMILIVGRRVGFASVGAAEGITVGAEVERPVGDWVGESVGFASVGPAEGTTVGAEVGRPVGDSVRESVSSASLGAAEGITVRAKVGRPVGDSVGESTSSASLGAAEGITDGAGAGRPVRNWVGESVSSASVDASGMSNVFGVIWSTSSSPSEPFELVEALLPPALLFPDLLAEEDVLLDFPELPVFSDVDSVLDLPHESGSDFEPLLFEDFFRPLGRRAP